MREQSIYLIILLCSIFSVITFLTIVVTEVIKSVFEIKGSKKLNILATSTALLLSVLSYFIYVGYTRSVFIWYYLVGAVLGGFIVALASMQGWDKLFSIWKKAKVDDVTIEEIANSNIDPFFAVPGKRKGDS